MYLLFTMQFKQKMKRNVVMVDLDVLMREANNSRYALHIYGTLIREVC